MLLLFMETTSTQVTRYQPVRVVVAKLIRADLKAAFPGVKFSVTSERSTVRIFWALGPTDEAVTALVEKYQAGSFDGMTDSYTFDRSRDSFRTVEYVFTSRDTSAVFEQVCRDICADFGIEYAGRDTVLSTNGAVHYVSDAAYRQLRQADLTNGYQGQVSR